MRKPAAPAAPLFAGGRMIAVSSAEMRAIDARSIELGTPGDVLMERAGARAVEALRERFRRELRRGVTIVAGKGNNGGDGLVMARLLRAARVRVSVFLAARGRELHGDAALNFRRLTKSGGKVREIHGSADDLEAVARSAESSGVLVDALFGTGLRGPLDESAQAIVRAMNAAPVPILAVDVPSGLDADRGIALGECVQAALTVTFAYPKLGLLLQPGATLAGDVVVADIGIDARAAESVGPKGRLLMPAVVAAAVGPRAADSHKGTYGHVLVLAGALGKIGAAALCGRAALRTGSGLATVASPGPALGPLLALTPELMTEPLPDEAGAWAFDGSVRARLVSLLEGKNAVVLGPGIGTAGAARALTEWLIDASAVPVVIDADGLNCLATRLDRLRNARAPIVLTPHPGEMSRLLGASTADVQHDRIGCARRVAEAHGVTVVLKGSRTVIAGPDGRVSINPTGNPGMASGGMGDALAGIVGSLLGQGIPAFEAAEVGVFLHGSAADRVTARRGEAGLLASDLIEELPPTIAALQRGFLEDVTND